MVGAGGLIGSVARYLVVVWLSGDGSARFPLGTFTVNIVGCFLIGLIAGFTERFELSPELRLTLAAGFCAGFTTFSSFAFENIRLLQNKDYLTFALYTILSFALGLLATLGGITLARD